MINESVSHQINENEIRDGPQDFTVQGLTEHIDLDPYLATFPFPGCVLALALRAACKVGQSHFRHPPAQTGAPNPLKLSQD